jgi:hypothetical protein
MSSLTAAVAAYGAILSTVAIAWNIWSWRREHSTRVVVNVTTGFLTFGPELSDPMVFVSVVNKSQHPVKIASAGLELQDGSGRTAVFLHSPPGSTLPGEVAPRDSAATWEPMSVLDGGDFDFTRPVVGWANDATGTKHRSKRRTLRSRG